MKFKVKFRYSGITKTFIIKNCESSYDATLKLSRYCERHNIKDYSVIDLVEIVENDTTPNNSTVEDFFNMMENIRR